MASYSEIEKTILMNKDLPENEQCSYFVQASCGGAPGWAIDYDVTTITDDDVYFHFLEYQNARPGVEYISTRLSETQSVNEFGM